MTLADNNRPLIMAIDQEPRVSGRFCSTLQAAWWAADTSPSSPIFQTSPDGRNNTPSISGSKWARPASCYGAVLTPAPGKSRSNLTTQRGTVVSLDGAGKPLRPAILWLDQRHADIDGPLPGPWGWLFRGLGLGETIDQFRRNAQANWLARNQPDLWCATEKYLLLSGYLTWRLTGNYRDSTGSQVGYLPFDYKRHRWARPGDFKWKLMPVRLSQLPELVAPGESLGSLTPEAAAHLGVATGLPLVASASDKTCEVLGSGGTGPEVACLSYGTTATVNVTNRRYIEAIRLMPPYPSALPGHYSSEVMIYRGYWMVSWFKREFGLREQRMAEKRGLRPKFCSMNWSMRCQRAPWA